MTKRSNDRAGLALPRRHFAAGAAALATSGLLPRPLGAQELQSSKPIIIVVPFAPGGPTDSVARAAGQRLADRLKMSVLIENKPGAAGSIGAKSVAAAEPDGHTLCVISAPLAHSQPTYRTPSYNLAKDFRPLAHLASVPMMLLAKVELPVRSMSELFAHAKSNPGKLACGSASPSQIAYLKSATGLDINSVTYRGSAQTLADLLGGQIDLGFVPYNDAAPQLGLGKLFPVLTTAPKRIRQLPDIAAVAERVPGFSIMTWFGLGAPAKVPDAIFDRLRTELIAIARSQEYKDYLAKTSIDAAEDPGAFDALIASEVAVWTKLVADGIIPLQGS